MERNNPLAKTRSPKTVLADSKKLMAKVKYDRKFRTDFLCIGIGIVVLLLAVSGIATLVISPLMTQYMVWKYGVVIETNTGESLLNVFRWEGAKVEGTGLVIPIMRCPIDDVDLLMLMTFPEKAWYPIEECLNATRSVIPELATKRTFIFMGVKDIEDTSLDISADALLDTMTTSENALMSSGFEYESGNLFELTSEEESIYTWLAINYNQGLINTETDTSSLYGVIEWGNYHVTITFIPSNTFTDIAASNDLTYITLFNKDYTIFSQSYSCVGRKELHARFLAKIIKNANYAAQLTDPCLNTGTPITVALDSVWNTECTESSKPDDDVDVPDSFEITGSIDMTQCLTIITSLMNTSVISLSCSDNKPCTYGMIQMLNPSGNFLATHFFSSTMELLGYSGNDTYYTLFRAVYNFCMTPYANLSQSFMDEAHLCLDALYALKLLREGFEFDSAEWGITFSSDLTVNDTWPMGYMLNVSNSIVEDSTRVLAFVADKYYFLFLVLVHSLVVVGILFVVYGVCIRKAQMNTAGYLNVMVPL